MSKIDLKKVIEKCPNYYDIMSEKFPQDDIVSHELVRYYKAIIANTHYSDNDELNRAMLLDKSMYAYFNNNSFNNIIVESVKKIDRQTDIGMFMISNYQAFEANPENKASMTRWI